MNTSRICLALALALLFTAALGGARAETFEDIPLAAGMTEQLLSRPLPIDFSGGAAPVEDCFDGFEAYDDPTLHVDIVFKEKQIPRGLLGYWVATVRVGDASQLRTAAAESFSTNTALPGPEIAARVQAVLAVDGDYYGYHRNGYILRQGQLFRDKLDGARDVLLIDEDGDFHVVVRPPKGTVNDTVDGKKVINALFFGPALVLNGETTVDFRYDVMDPDKHYDRICICQTGPLEYKIICSTGMRDGHVGIKLEDFAELAQEEGAITAYNLDGGNSTMLYFHGEKLNTVDRGKTRDLMDIIYFASAWTGEE